jgi:hypothetical protein
MRDSFDRTVVIRTVTVVLSIVVIVSISWAVIYERGYTLEEQSKSTSIAKDLLEITALIVGALWTFRIYLVSRTEREAVAVDQTVVTVPLPDGRFLLRVFVSIRNIGKVKVELETWRLRADLILPVAPPFVQLLSGSNAFSERQAKWLPLTNADQGTFTGNDFQITIEPGESELQIGNLVVAKWAEVLQVYSHFQRRLSAKDQIEGWSQRTMVDLRKGIHDEQSRDQLSQWLDE